MRTAIGVLVVSCGGVLLGGGCDGARWSDFAFQPLEFPFADPGVVARLAAYGIPEWSGSEPHNGIDLVVDDSLASARVVSPTAGVVTRISVSENPYSDPPAQLLVTVEIRVNSEWTVSLVLEPSTADPALRAAQLAAIRVSEGQTVSAGTPIADLLVGTLGYPHLHYMAAQNRETTCAYAYSSDAARDVFAGLAALPGSSLPDGNVCYGEP
jgi:murein DD-endopeptidase MepM/ murein hydrolase activator NlpD